MQGHDGRQSWKAGLETPHEDSDFSVREHEYILEYIGPLQLSQQMTAHLMASDLTNALAHRSVSQEVRLAQLVSLHGISQSQNQGVGQTGFYWKTLG